MAYKKPEKVEGSSTEQETKTETLETKTSQNQETVTISKSEFDQMKAQMETLMQMMAMGAIGGKQESKKEEKYITFVNMTKGKFVLKGNSYYTIDEQFGTRRFIEREARMIVNNMPQSVRDGKVYILDADFVKDCELEDVYVDLLSNKQMKELLTKEPSYVAEVYKNANKAQKQIIVDMIENKKLNGEDVDANILLQIGQLSGKNLIEIAPIGDEDMKEG